MIFVLKILYIKKIVYKFKVNKMKIIICKKTLVFLVTLLFFGVATAPYITADINNTNQLLNKIHNLSTEMIDIEIRFYGIDEPKKYTVTIPKNDATAIEELFNELNEDIKNAENKEEIIQLYNDAALSLKNYGLFPDDTSLEEIQQIITGSNSHQKAFSLEKTIYDFIDKYEKAKTTDEKFTVFNDLITSMQKQKLWPDEITSADVYSLIDELEPVKNKENISDTLSEINSLLNDRQLLPDGLSVEESQQLINNFEQHLTSTIEKGIDNTLKSPSLNINSEKQGNDWGLLNKYCFIVTKASGVTPINFNSIFGALIAMAALLGLGPGDENFWLYVLLIIIGEIIFLYGLNKPLHFFDWIHMEKSDSKLYYFTSVGLLGTRQFKAPSSKWKLNIYGFLGLSIKLDLNIIDGKELLLGASLAVWAYPLDNNENTQTIPTSQTQSSSQISSTTTQTTAGTTTINQ